MWLDKFKFKTLLKKKTPFSYNRFNDGEWQIISNISKTFRREYSFKRHVPSHQSFRKQLESALKHQGDSYYVGMVDKRIKHGTYYTEMIQSANQPTRNTTSAVLFTNENYKFYMNNIYPIYTLYTNIVMICNPEVNIKKLSFSKNVKYVVNTPPPNAWEKLPGIQSQLDSIIDTIPSHTLFLFSAGPISKVLIKNSYIKNDTHTYIDVGSLHDLITGLGKSRGYLKQIPNLDI
tara:strand:+ start:1934 stop:2632 length:699 start_codon:yes stop_codon:yes gene_type:complete